MLNDIKTKLADLVDGDRIVLDKYTRVKISRFAELFSECTEFSYQELKRVDAKMDYGYDRYIEQWKEQGLIS